jgi:hypothetical protein
MEGSWPTPSARRAPGHFVNRGAPTIGTRDCLHRTRRSSRAIIGCTPEFDPSTPATRSRASGRTTARSCGRGCLSSSTRAFEKQHGSACSKRPHRARTCRGLGRGSAWTITEAITEKRACSGESPLFALRAAPSRDEIKYSPPATRPPAQHSAATRNRALDAWKAPKIRA